MLKTLLLATLITLSTLAHSTITPIAQCGETQGYSYFPNRQIPKTLQERTAENILGRPIAPDNWRVDGFRDGSITLVQLATGSLDIIIYNNPRQTTFSSVADGGQVALLRKTQEDLAVIVWYRTTAEIYTFVQTPAGPRVSVLGTRNQMHIRTSMFVGECKYININALQ
jgi:hypothetical protein